MSHLVVKTIHEPGMEIKELLLLIKKQLKFRDLKWFDHSVTPLSVFDQGSEKTLYKCHGDTGVFMSTQLGK